jgi:hypothetical protein
MKQLLVIASAILLTVSACKKDEKTKPTETPIIPVTTTPSYTLAVTVANLTAIWNISQLGSIDTDSVITLDDYIHACATKPEYYELKTLSDFNYVKYDDCTSAAIISANDWVLNADNQIVIGENAEIWDVLELTTTFLKLRERTLRGSDRVMTFTKQLN